ncbi:MAG: PTS sugar transporter subunit IIC [Deltaproteobacteria bacterium]|nr:PTS sugar transporter subunit IIC [Deltaproteobacteria bacterium]MCW8892401.1 PTS sugar transporter subunit IIC [Deltaproteobacteria bacterium]MCW9050155.1 PTS sugar transporter subunit IIC [Deltaproteobacteria bacterium]
MISVDLLLGALIATICGLDRVAILQFMLSRPIVAAPLVALVLGEPVVGLQVGLLVELLWLARLPVGAAVPPDDTQVAIASSVMVIVSGRFLNAGGIELILICLLVALPLGKVGQYFEHYARQYNVRLSKQVELALENGSIRAAEWQHLRGLISFSLAAIATYAVILAGGLTLVPLIWPLLQGPLSYSSDWVALAMPLIGIAVILGTINVSRAITLFCASFGMAFLLMWLV